MSVGSDFLSSRSLPLLGVGGVLGNEVHDDERGTANGMDEQKSVSGLSESGTETHSRPLTLPAEILVSRLFTWVDV